MQSHTETIRSLLRQYAFYKAQVENGLGGDTLREKVKFLEIAISLLGDKDYKLIKGIYLDRLSIEELSKLLCIHRSTAFRRINVIVKNMAKVYEMQFGE